MASGHVNRIERPPYRRRQLNTWVALTSYWRATTETDAPGASEADTISTLQRLRPPLVGKTVCPPCVEALPGLSEQPSLVRIERESPQRKEDIRSYSCCAAAPHLFHDRLCGHIHIPRRISTQKPRTRTSQQGGPHRRETTELRSFFLSAKVNVAEALCRKSGARQRHGNGGKSEASDQPRLPEPPACQGDR